MLYVYVSTTLIRVACRPADQVRQVPWSAGQVPHQTLLHFQHAHHLADRPRQQSLLSLAASLQ